MAQESLQLLKQREERTRALWQRRRDIPLAILGWTGVVALILWGAGHIVRTLLILTLAALLAYALAPAVKLFQRIMPQVLAMLLVYLIMLGALSALLFLIVNTAIGQVASLAHSVGFLLIPQGNGKLTPLEQTLRSFGISPSQIATARGPNCVCPSRATPSAPGLRAERAFAAGP